MFSEAEHFLFRSAATTAKPIHYLEHPPFSHNNIRKTEQNRKIFIFPYSYKSGIHILGDTKNCTN